MGLQQYIGTHRTNALDIGIILTKDAPRNFQRQLRTYYARSSRISVSSLGGLPPKGGPHMANGHGKGTGFGR